MNETQTRTNYSCNFSSILVQYFLAFYLITHTHKSACITLLIINIIHTQVAFLIFGSAFLFGEMGGAYDFDDGLLMMR